MSIAELALLALALSLPVRAIYSATKRSQPEPQTNPPQRVESLGDPEE